MLIHCVLVLCIRSTLLVSECILVLRLPVCVRVLLLVLLLRSLLWEGWVGWSVVLARRGEEESLTICTTHSLKVTLQLCLQHVQGALVGKIEISCSSPSCFLCTVNPNIQIELLTCIIVLVCGVLRLWCQSRERLSSIVAIGSN